MEQKEIVLINKHRLPLTINFQGIFPNNKRAVTNGKFYLTEKEWEWVQHNLSYLIDSGMVVLEGSEETEEKTETTSDQEKAHKEFFEQHVNKAKAKVSKMEDLEEINALIEYANDNEINNKAVDALIERANKLGE